MFPLSVIKLESSWKEFEYYVKITCGESNLNPDTGRLARMRNYLELSSMLESKVLVLNNARVANFKIYSINIKRLRLYGLCSAPDVYPFHDQTTSKGAASTNRRN